MYQQITIVGHLGKDPESKQSQSGKQYTTVSLAVSRKISAEQKETTWFVVTAWENQGSYLANYAQKGSLVMVVGRLNPGPNGQPRAWLDQSSGQPKAAYEVTAQDIKILSGFRTADDRNATPQPTQARKNPGTVGWRKTDRDLDREDNPDFEY